MFQVSDLYLEPETKPPYFFISHHHTYTTRNTGIQEYTTGIQNNYRNTKGINNYKE